MVWEEALVEIISKRDGPRREDVAARRVIEKNQGTIRRMMDHLTGGPLGRRPQRPAPPEPEGLIVHTGRAGSASSPVEPYVRVSANGRVVVADLATNRQLHFLGELRGPRRQQRFVLATEANGFFARIDDELGALLADLDGATIAGEVSEDDLVAVIGERLGLGPSGAAEPATDR